MKNSITMHVGLDVHKDSIELAAADVGGGEVRRGSVGWDLPALDAALARLRCPVACMEVVYEAGPCGYAIYLHLAARDTAWVVVPSLTPKQPGKRIKTDRRDALKLARLSRAGELRAIQVPDAENEPIRDLLRTREYQQDQPSQQTTCAALLIGLPCRSHRAERAGCARPLDRLGTISTPELSRR